MITPKTLTMTMPNYKLSLYERETIINFDESQDPATVFTYNAAMIRKLDRLSEERPDEVKVIRAESVAGCECREYEVPKKWVKINAPRILSEEQREAARKRLQEINSESRSYVTTGAKKD